MKSKYKRYDKRVQVLLNLEMLEDLQKDASSEGLAVSPYIRNLITKKIYNGSSTDKETSDK